MNILYQSLFPASLLPSCIVCLFYFVHGHWFPFVVLTTHITTQVIVIYHKPVKFDIITWNRYLNLQRIFLWVSYAMRNWFPSYTCLVFFLFLHPTMLKKYDKLKTPTIHSFALLMFCSTASFFQIFIASLSCTAYLLVNKPLAIQWEDKKNIELYFQSRMLYNYLIAIAEWSVSTMDYKSLPLLIIACIVFNLSVFYNVRGQSNKEEWYEPVNLPEDYPYPLNIKDALDRCNLAKKLFKCHSI